MNATKLQKIIEDAMLCANVVLTFKKFAVNPLEVFKAELSADLLIHFANTGRIQIVAQDAEKSQFTIAKTTLFVPQDAQELAERIAFIVIAAEARSIPLHQLYFEFGDTGAQLRLVGGNKLLRTLFVATIAATEKFYGFVSTVALNKDGVAVLDLSAASEDSALVFAETVAKIFKTELLM